MAHLKRQALLGLAIVDIVIAIGISSSRNGSAGLQGWLWLNFIVIALSLSIFFGLKLRKRRLSRSQVRVRSSYRRDIKRYDDPYHSPQLTLDGDFVKSGGEKLIANYLHDHNIKYEYEKPVTDSSNRRISSPDFYLPEYDLYIEYWGMVNTKEHHKRQEYIKGMEWKMGSAARLCISIA